VIGGAPLARQTNPPPRPDKGSAAEAPGPRVRREARQPARKLGADLSGRNAPPAACCAHVRSSVPLSVGPSYRRRRRGQTRGAVQTRAPAAARRLVRTRSPCPTPPGMRAYPGSSAGDDVDDFQAVAVRQGAGRIQKAPPPGRYVRRRRCGEGSFRALRNSSMVQGDLRGDLFPVGDDKVVGASGSQRRVPILPDRLVTQARSKSATSPGDRCRRRYRTGPSRRRPIRWRPRPIRPCVRVQGVVQLLAARSGVSSRFGVAAGADHRDAQRNQAVAQLG
jgi:hypothetical protein